MHQKLSAIDLIYSALFSSYLFRKLLKTYVPNLLNDQDSRGVFFWIAVSSTSKEQAISLFRQFSLVVPTPTSPSNSHLL